MRDKRPLKGSSSPGCAHAEIPHTAHHGSGWQRTAAGHVRHGSGTPGLLDITAVGGEKHVGSNEKQLRRQEVDISSTRQC